MAKQKKRPTAPTKPTEGKPMVLPGGGKLPGVGNSHQRVCWRFTHVDNEGPWGLALLDQLDLATLLAELVKFESQTINELFHQGEWPGKFHDVPLLPNKHARGRLEAIGLGDMTKIWKLRVGGPGRLWGFLVDNIFHVVWWDPKHEIWPSSR